MKIRAAPSTGCPVPQFIVTPETDEDRMLLRAFVLFRDHSSKPWEFRFHGACFGDGDVQSFNFGWAPAHQSMPDNP